MKHRNELAHIVRHFCTRCALHISRFEKELGEFMSPSIREVMMNYAWQFIGTWYRWGGDDPSGFDCSGFCIEVLRSVGALPRQGDWTADDLWMLFANRRVPRAYEGCLVFWANNEGKAVHIELCIDEVLALGASGGGSKTLTMEDAQEQNAFIKMRPIASRANVLGYVDPLKED